MVGRRGYLHSFWKCMFYFVCYHSGWTPGAKVGPWGTNNTLSSAPSAERGDKRLLAGWSGGSETRGPSSFCLTDQEDFWGDLGPGSLALREGVALCRPWTPSILLILIRSGLRSGWHWLSCLLSRRKYRATESSRRAGAFREEVSHRLRRLLSLREAFRKTLHSWSKQAAWRDQIVKEGNLVLVLGHPDQHPHWRASWPGRPEAQP